MNLSRSIHFGFKKIAGSIRRRLTLNYMVTFTGSRLNGSRRHSQLTNGLLSDFMAADDTDEPVFRD